MKSQAACPPAQAGVPVSTPHFFVFARFPVHPNLFIFF
jgi:hypothetical protein